MLRSLGLSLAIFLIAATFARAAGEDARAQALLKNRQYGPAHQEWLRIAQESQNPKLALRARLEACKCLFLLGDWDAFVREGEPLLSNKAALSPGSCESLSFDLASAKLRQGHYEEARKAFQSFVGTYPLSVQELKAQLQATQCLFELHAFEAYRAETSGWITRHPTATQVPELRLGVARSLDHQGLTSASRAAYLQTASDYSKAPWALDARVSATLCLFKMRQYGPFLKEAQAFLRKQRREAGEAGARLALSVTQAAARQGNWRLAADQALALLTESRPKDEFVRLGALIADAEACFHLAQTAQARGLARTQAQLERRRAIQLQVFRSAAAKTLASGDADSTRTRELRAMAVQACYLERDYAALAREALRLSGQYVKPSRLWALGRFWEGVAKASQAPADLSAAAAAFDELLQAQVNDPDLDDHLPSKAVLWRLRLARQQNDPAALARTMQIAREQLPDGPIKLEILREF